MAERGGSIADGLMTLVFFIPFQFSTLAGTEKTRALSLWEKRWYEFVEGLVSNEFGDFRA